MKEVAKKEVKTKVRTLSKQQLCVLFGLWTGKAPQYKRLRKDYFTSEVLNTLGMTRKEYNNTRTFTAIQSQNIMTMFDIDQSEL